MERPEEYIERVTEDLDHGTMVLETLDVWASALLR